jgi:hypothetical protein
LGKGDGGEKIRKTKGGRLRWKEHGLESNVAVSIVT